MIDLEAEYDNRARVPDHREIFARWTSEASLYRERLTAQGRAELALRYGESARQTIDLFFAEQREHAPLALFIHGGYWRSLDPSLFSHVAAGLNDKGVSVAVAGYDLCPQVRIGDIVEELREAGLYLWRRFGRKCLVYGHSAGGHLAAAMLATDWTALDSSAPADFVPAASAISGVFDLTPLLSVSMNDDLRLSEPEAKQVSPLFWPAPTGRTLDVLVGARESGEFLRQSREITRVWGRSGVATRYEEVAGADHFTVLDPLSDPKSPMNARLAELARLTRS